RSGTSTLGLTSILPPRCIANTGSSSRADGEREIVASSATVNPQEFGTAGDRSAVLLACGGGGEVATRRTGGGSLWGRGLPVGSVCHERLAASAVSAVL